MSWNDAEIAFAETFAAYESRPSQRDLAEHIEASLAAERTIMAQAPTGTGKSLAAMVPAIDYARVHHKPVVACTGTKNLQDQYIRDMQNLQATVFPDLKFVVLKGRSNYLCQAKLADIEKDASLAPELSVEALRAAGEAEGVYGDVERLGIPLTPYEKAAVTISTEECPGAKACPFAVRCFAERIKTKAEEADVVIANHALVAINEVLKAQNIPMLPDFAARVIDEAHEFENYVSNALSTQLTERGMTLLATRVAEFTGEREVQGEVNLAAKMLFDRLRFLMANRDDKRESTVAITPAVLITLNDELGRMIRAVQQMQGDLAAAVADTDEEVLKRKRLRKRVFTLEQKLRQIIMADFDDMVRWVEREERRYGDRTDERIFLCQAPLEIADFLREFFWAEGSPTTVLVSATLAVEGDFGYLANKLGMSDYDTFDCPTPFNYEEQAVIYAPKELPDPSKEAGAYQSAVNLHLAELVRASDGRALILFTSWDMLNATYRALAPVIGGMGHRVLKQGDAPPRVLAEDFKNDEHAVLLATKSFYTGVDITGDSLRLLAIVKLPMPPKSVLFDARCAVIDERSSGFKDSSFMKIWVPEMIMSLTQGVGRLIRTVTDRGLVAILDPRLYSKPSYGRKTLRSITKSFPAPVVTELPQATGYLRSLDMAPV